MKRIVAIVVRAKEWHARAAGQHYCSSRTNVIYADGTSALYYSKFANGYDDAYVQFAFERLNEEGVLPPNLSRRWCWESNVTLLTSKCAATKDETKRWGEA